MEILDLVVGIRHRIAQQVVNLDHYGKLMPKSKARCFLVFIEKEYLLELNRELSLEYVVADYFLV